MEYVCQEANPPNVWVDGDVCKHALDSTIHVCMYDAYMYDYEQYSAVCCIIEDDLKINV